MQNAHYLHHDCRLHKAIYGLKKAPRAWYQVLRTFLLGLGFVTFPEDSSLFVYSRCTVLIYFLVYVNNLIIIGSDPSLVDNIIWRLDSKFSTKDLRVLYFFCGIKVLASSTSLLLSRQKYVIDLLSKHNMLHSKPVSTSLAVDTSLTTTDGFAPINATMYRQVVGSLQHLWITCPNISFAVNKLSCFMHVQSKHH